MKLRELQSAVEILKPIAQNNHCSITQSPGITYLQESPCSVDEDLSSA